MPAASQQYGQFSPNSTQVASPYSTQHSPYAGTGNAQVQQPGQPFQYYPGPHAYLPNQAYPSSSQQYAQSTPQQPYMPNRPAQQQVLQNQSAPYRSAPAHQQGTASPDANESAGESWDILGEWKWHILATIIGIILVVTLHNFRVTLWEHTTPLVLTIPLFFGAAFGPWVGLLVGVLGWLCSGYVYPGHELLFLVLFRGVYMWWIPLLLVGVTGFAAGLSMLRKRKYPTVSSSIRACILTIIALACCIGFMLNQANELRLFPQIAIIALLNIGIGFVSLVVYSIVVRLIDAF